MIAAVRICGARSGSGAGGLVLRLRRVDAASDWLAARCPSTSRKMNRSHGGHQRGRGAPSAEAVDRLAGLAQPGREPGEVAVAGDDREPVEGAGVEQVHRVDDQRGVRGVLAGRVGELLDRLDRVPVQLLLPAHQLLGRPVAVGALDRRHAVPRQLLEQRARRGWRRCCRRRSGRRGGWWWSPAQGADPAPTRLRRAALGPGLGGGGARRRRRSRRTQRPAGHERATSSTAANGSSAPSRGRQPDGDRGEAVPAGAQPGEEAASSSVGWSRGARRAGRSRR